MILTSPPLMANSRQRASWSSARMLTQNAPDAWMAGQLFEVLVAQIDTSGGSSDTDVNETAVKPAGAPPDRPVTTVTPVQK